MTRLLFVLAERLEVRLVRMLISLDRFYVGSCFNYELTFLNLEGLVSYDYRLSLMPNCAFPMSYSDDLTISVSYDSNFFSGNEATEIEDIDARTLARIYYTYS